MIGQGSPQSSPGRSIPLFGPPLVFLIMFVLGTFHLSGVCGFSDELPINLRIYWGGGDPEQWEGRVWLSRGAIVSYRLLGDQPDGPASVYVINGQLHIQHTRPRTSDGMDIKIINVPPDAELIVELKRTTSSTVPTPLRFPLSELMQDTVGRTLDDRDNQLLIGRTPGDKFGVKFNRESLVFSPGESLGFEIIPNRIGLPANTPIHLSVELRYARNGRTIDRYDEDLITDAEGQLVDLRPIKEFRLEYNTERVYELVLRLTDGRTWTRIPIAQPVRFSELVRKVQLIVIDPRQRPDVPDDDDGEVEVVRFDPEARGRWDIFTKPFNRIPLRRFGPWEPTSTAKSRVWQHEVTEYQGEEYVELEPGEWHTYPFAVQQPGVPHRLEIDYPADIPQTLDVTVVESSEGGWNHSHMCVAGIHVPPESEKNIGVVKQHRVVFWPNGTNPQILLRNRQDQGNCRYGTVRVAALTGGLPEFAIPDVPYERRRLIAYIDRPSITSNFVASEAVDEVWNAGLQDWQTFYEAGRRLVDYLQHEGFDTAIVNVYSEGSTIYPSKLLQPNARFDNGVFFVSGQDLVRKDVLEMLFRLFDRAGIELVPALQFATPLPVLERQLKSGADGATGIRLVNTMGRTWIESHGTHDGLAPYYNPLDHRVQAAMQDVVDELVSRYRHHRSFAGIALDLSPTGFAVLPGVAWGFDDQTIKRFAREAAVEVLEPGPDRFSRREARLRDDQEYRKQWLTWRSAELAKLHRGLCNVVNSKRAGSTLYLLGPNLLDKPQIQQKLRPSLPMKNDQALFGALLDFGLDAPAYQGEPNIIFARPRRLDQLTESSSTTVFHDVEAMVEIDRFFELMANQATLSFHVPTLNSGDDLGDGIEQRTFFGGTNQVSYLAPSDYFNRKRFAHSLATMDSQLMIEGGRMLPLVLEPSAREFLEIYRRLPFAQFTSVLGETSTQPVVIRKYSKNGRTCVYLVNDSLWKVSVDLQMDVSVTTPIESLSEKALPALVDEDNRTTWRVSFEPYELVAAWIQAEDVNIQPIKTTLPEEAVEGLQKQIDQLRVRLRELRLPPPLEHPDNRGFEEVRSDEQPVPKWWKKTGDRMGATVESKGTRTGQGCLRLWNQSENDQMWLRSTSFQPPNTGRLATWVWLRVDNPSEQPELRLSVDAKYNGQEYYRHAPVGRGTEFPLTDQWVRYIFSVDDLPVEGLTDLRVGFDLMRPGEVWVDSVQTFDLAFTQSEQHELTKIIGLANLYLREGQVADCQRVLHGYWPRFLRTFVEVPAQPPFKIAVLPKGKSTVVTPGKPSVSENKLDWFDRLKRWTPNWPSFLR